MKKLQGNASQKQLTGHLFTKWHILNLRLFTVLNEDKISQEKGNYLSRTRPSKDERKMRLEVYFSLLVLQWMPSTFEHKYQGCCQKLGYLGCKTSYLCIEAQMENEKSLKAFTWSGIKVKYSTNIFISHNYKYNAYLKKPRLIHIWKMANKLLNHYLTW